MADPLVIPRISIQIDEEGFPLFDGLRIDDAAICREIFSQLRRADPRELRSPLLTQSGGTPCLVNAFSAPLVAQSVDEVSDEKSIWIFPGGLRHEVPAREIFVDEWHRLHSWIGADKIAALLSPRAQSALLQRMDLTHFSPAPWRRAAAPTQDLNSPYWTAAYDEGRDGWDMGTASPVLTAQFPQLKSAAHPDAAILVPGAGRGHDAQFFAQQSLRVTALDFSGRAQAEFHRLYPESPVNFLRDDVFLHLAAQREAYDLIFEHTIFCAIDPQLRREYVAKVAGALRPGGLWFGIFFACDWPDGPPFGLSQWELRDYVSQNFDILAWQMSKASHPRRFGTELWASFRRRP